VVIADASSLWLLVTLVILAIGVVGLGINANIRRSRDSSMRQAGELQEEVRRLRTEQAKVKFEQERAAQDEAELRRRALEEALRREPDLQLAHDEAAAARLTALVDQIVQELVIRRELEEVKAAEAERVRVAKLALEVATRKEEERKRQQAARDAEAVQRREEARRRQEYLDSLPSWRRWVEEHKSLAVLSAVLVGAIVISSSVAAGVIAVQSTQAEERARLEEEQAKVAREEKERLDKEAAAKERTEQEFQDALPTACDLSIDKSRIPQEVWAEWLRCEDLAVVVEASFWLMDEAEILFRRQNYDGIQQALTRVVVKSKDSELISRISAHPDIAREIHEEIVRRWDPEVAAASYAAFYDQQCSMGMKPESYIGSTRWLDPLGGTVLFDGQSCKATGFTVESKSPSLIPRVWFQDGETVVISRYHYILAGDTLTFSPQATGKYVGEPPDVLTRAN
jgi:hypothetical protein